MARFNTVSTGTKTTNVAGGEAYKQSPELEFVSLLLTSFANDSFYEKAGKQLKRIEDLLSKVDPLFAAKAAIYARNEFGMRSITHVAAKTLAPSISGQKWAKDFYRAIVYRPDDMTEIVSLFEDKKKKGTGRVLKSGKTKSPRTVGKVLPMALKKGFAEAFDKFDGYQIAKYRAENKAVKLVDVVNMVHPVPTDKNAEALKGLIAGTLVSTDTWESKMTKAGQTAENEDDLANLKKGVWTDLITSRKLPYFALLRNLRNIITQAPEAIPAAMEMLTDEKLIKKSLVLPFRFMTANDEILGMQRGEVREVLVSIAKAVEISLSNVPKFDGKTLVVLDVSGSMAGQVAKIAALFAGVLIKVNNADLIVFDTSAKIVNINPLDSLITISNALRFSGGGTDFNTFFPVASKKYDRVIILSDMQGWVDSPRWGGSSPMPTFANYKQRTGADPLVYSFDLKNYGTMEFPERNVFCLAGWSDKVFDVMKLLETDRNALINKIWEVQF